MKKAMVDVAKGLVQLLDAYYYLDSDKTSMKLIKALYAWIKANE